MFNWTKKLKDIWSQDMAIDLGTANTLVVAKGNQSLLLLMKMERKQCLR